MYEIVFSIQQPKAIYFRKHFGSGLQTKYRKTINKSSKKKIIRYKPLNLQMKKINRKVWSLIKRLMTSWKTGTYLVVYILTTCCASSERIAKRPTHITLFNANIDCLKKNKDVLNFVTQTWRRLAGVMIQMLFIDGTYSSVKWLRNQIVTKAISARWKRSENFLRLSFKSLFKTKKFCSLYHRQQNIMIKNTY